VHPQSRRLCTRSRASGSVGLESMWHGRRPCTAACWLRLLGTLLPCRSHPSDAKLAFHNGPGDCGCRGVRSTKGIDENATRASKGGQPEARRGLQRGLKKWWAARCVQTKWGPELGFEASVPAPSAEQKRGGPQLHTQRGRGQQGGREGSKRGGRRGMQRNREGWQSEKQSGRRSA
jgi:hypothetical protein